MNCKEREGDKTRLPGEAQAGWHVRIECGTPFECLLWGTFVRSPGRVGCAVVDEAIK